MKRNRWSQLSPIGPVRLAGLRVAQEMARQAQSPLAWVPREASHIYVTLTWQVIWILGRLTHSIGWSWGGGACDHRKL